MTKMTTSVPDAPLRKAPDSEGEILGKLPQLTSVEKQAENNIWYLVSAKVDDHELQGWINSAILEAQTSPVSLFTIDSDLTQRPSLFPSGDKIDNYLEARESPLKGIGNAVIEASQKYGINSTYIVSHAIIETGWGTSDIYKDKNNLFGWQAYDANPYDASRSFSSREECIDFVMGRIKSLYLTSDGKYFCQRPCLGNKSYGMNVHYASSPLWGQDIATVARKMESWFSSIDESMDMDLCSWPDPKRILDAVAKVNPMQPYYLAHDITGDNIPETFCNWFANDVLYVLGIHLPTLDASSGYYIKPHPIYGNTNTLKPLLANKLHDYFLNGGDGKWESVSKTGAVNRANQGKAVVASKKSAKHGHIAIVIPGGQGSEVRIAQAGRINDTNMSLEKGFGNDMVDFFTYTG